MMNLSNGRDAREYIEDDRNMYVQDEHHDDIFVLRAYGFHIPNRRLPVLSSQNSQWTQGLKVRLLWDESMHKKFYWPTHLGISNRKFSWQGKYHFQIIVVQIPKVKVQTIDIEKPMHHALC